MKIDFNNVRREAIASYSRLVRTLNSHQREGQIVLTVDEISTDMDDLRSSLVGIGATYEPDNDEFQCVLGDTPVPSLKEE